MTIQEAYKKLDLAKGLDINRVENQYSLLKSEIEGKINSTMNEKLLQLYSSRLNEIEEAYQFLVENLSSESNSNENIQNDNKISKNFKVKDSKQNSGKSKAPIILLSVIILVLIGGGIFYFSKYTSEQGQETIDHFRILHGEQQVFVHDLNMRQYPNTEATLVNSFPFGTRLLPDSLERSTMDDKGRLWKKVKFIHPEYGWDTPEDYKKNEGWIASAQCSVDWIADSSHVESLNQIFGNERAGINITSGFRFALVDYFEEKNYFGEWVIFGKEKEAQYKNITRAFLNTSEKDCNDSDQKELLLILDNPKQAQSNDNSQVRKLIVISLNNSQKGYSIVFDRDLTALGGFRNLTYAEKMKFKRFVQKNNLNSELSPTILEYKNSDELLYSRNGELSSVLLNDLY